MKKTFKQFFIKESAIREYYSGRQLSTEEILKLPEPGPKNFEGKFRVGQVYFDNIDGIGSVPDSQNVIYKGFVAMMTPVDFLKFTHSSAGREKTGSEIAELIEDGFPISSPFLEVLLDPIEEGKFAVIVGHEGRGRCLALIELAKAGKAGLSMKSEIPVHFFPRDGRRARHITPDIIESIKDHGFIPETEKSENPKFATKVKILQKLYINGSEIDL